MASGFMIYIKEKKLVDLYWLSDISLYFTSLPEVRVKMLDLWTLPRGPYNKQCVCECIICSQVMLSIAFL